MSEPGRLGRDIAIVGAAVRIPGASTPEAFVDRLLRRAISASPFPEQRTQLLDRAGLRPPSRARAGGFLEDIQSFDPEFFGINEADARYLDPQQRLFLDVAWEAVERAGYRPDRLPDSRAGVFLGISANDFTQWTRHAGAPIEPSRISGGLNSFAASRVAYCLDLTGPAVAVDAACASSLLAVHLAIQSLRSGESHLCIAGGVNVLLLGEPTDLLDQAALLSHDGRCRSYHDAANGYFRSEGAAALVLKRVSDALQDGDEIVAVILGTAVAQDGRARAGLVAPGIGGQRQAALLALADAGVDPSTIGLLEAQGTATSLADGMEVKALSEAYGGRGGRCALGSVKTQLGHLEAAAGAVSLLSAALALRSGVVSPNGDVEAPSRAIEFENTPFFLADWPRPLPRSTVPRRAAVHCHEMGGLNVHLILEEAPQPQTSAVVDDVTERPELFLLSARTIEALQADVDAVLDVLAKQSRGSLADWCLSVRTSRKPRAQRLAIVARSRDQLADRLHLWRLAPQHPTLRASWIFASAAIADPLVEDIGGLSVAVQAAIRRATTGRWSERHLHPRLATAGEEARVSEDERTAALKFMARAFVAGAEIDLPKPASAATRARVPLPPAARIPRPIWPVTSAPLDATTPPDLKVGPTTALLEPPDLKAGPTPTSAFVSGFTTGDGARETGPDRLESMLWRCLERASLRRIAERDPHVSFLDLGIESVALARFSMLLEEVFGTPVPVQFVFESPTMAALTSRVAAQATDIGVLETRLTSLESTGASSPEPTLDAFRMTPLQQAYHAAAEMGGALGGRSCQVFVELEIEGKPDHARLHATLQHLLERHPMLGAVFAPEGVQRFATNHRASAVALPFESLVGLDAAQAGARLAALRQQLLATGADLGSGPMIRCTVAELPHAFRLLLTLDLIVADLESLRIAIEDWRRLYETDAQELPPIRLTFDRYLRLVEERTLPRRERDRAYWTARLDRIPGPPTLPLACDPSALARAQFASKSFTLAPNLWERLKAQAKHQGVTQSALLGAAFAEMLARFGDGTDFCLNLPAFDRRPFHPDVERMVGPFSTNLLVAVSGEASDPITRARQFEAEVREALAHSTFSGVEVARLLASRRRSALPIAPVVFTAPLYGRRFDPWGKAVNVSSQTPHVWLDCQVVEMGEGLLLRWDYVEELFEPETIATMFRAFLGLVRTLAESRLPSLDGDHVRVRRAVASNTAVTAPTLDGLLAAQSERSPHQHAVSAGDAVARYGELDRRASRVAQRLRQAGIAKGDRVVIACDRGIDQIAMVAGALRAGAVYVPVECGQPDARAAQIVTDARPAAILVDPRNSGRGFVGGCTRISTTDALAFDSSAPLPVLTSGDDLAYIIYTSGSTGRPKGVMIAHGAAINTIDDINRRFDIGPFDRVLAFSSLGFDLSVWDLFGSFAAGAAVVVLSEEDLKTPSRWLERVRNAGVTVWSSVPTGMSMFVDFFEGRLKLDAPTLRLVMLSGDWIPVGLPHRIEALFDGVEIVSLGGATEASIWSCIFPIGAVEPAWTSIPYGRALANQSFHVLDEHMQPLGEGEVGELYIGGRGVALGYFGDEARTRERFVNGPRGLGCLYRTGDLGRWMPSGEMEFLGRKDMQVKIRGFRVEVAEIEAALRLHPAVADCAVSARGADRTEKELVAHYVERQSVDARDLLDHLRARLPDYMVPQHLVKLGSLPLNANGKIDRLQLS